jgi:butyrate kinase
LHHDTKILERFSSINAQREYRHSLIDQCLKDHQVPLKDLAAVVGRGGLLPPVLSGGYLVDDTMKRLILGIKYHARIKFGCDPIR